jgi:hypothetical protein
VDASGRSIAGAVVRVDKQNTSSGTGDFTIPVLPPGLYGIGVEKTRFSTLEHKDINVTVGGTVTLALKLAVGAVSTRVEVNAEAPVATRSNSAARSTVAEIFWTTRQTSTDRSDIPAR